MKHRICVFTIEAFKINISKIDADFVCFANENNIDGWIKKDLPLDVLPFSRIRQEKILKILVWKYLSEYDVAIWCKSENEQQKAVQIFKSIEENPDKDIWILNSNEVIDSSKNLNLISQLEKYSISSKDNLYQYTDAIAYSVHSPDFKKFSISWISETLKESLYDEVSFTYLRSITRSLNAYEVQEDISGGFDCFFKIVIPNYNNGTKLADCIESILNQSFKSFKIIVVDDCSTDNSIDIVRKYVESFPDLIFLVSSDERCYSGHARNLGMQYDGFTSKYTWFVDGDDRLFSQTTLKQLYEKASVIDADLISFDCIYIKDKKSDVHKFEVPDFSDPSKSLLQFGIAPWHRIVKTEKLVPFFENCVRRQDLATVFRQYSACSSFAHLNEVCYIYKSCDYANMAEALWSLQSVWAEMKRQAEDENIKKEIRNAIVAYLNRYPKIFGKFEKNDPREQKVVAMASYPPRKEGMMKTLNCLLPQCDYFCLYLNEYKEIPNEIDDLPQEFKNKLLIKINERNLKDYGKFYWFGLFPGYYLTVDDDLTYSDGYCDKLVSSLKDKKNKAVVGMHGNDFTIIDGSFVVKKTCHPFNGEESIDAPIDCVGTGAACFYPAALNKDFRKKLLSHFDKDDDLDMSASILVKSEDKMLYRIASKKNLVGMNGSNFINPLADISFAWEKRYIQYDLWLNRKSKNEKCAIYAIPNKKIDFDVLQLLNDFNKNFNSSDTDLYCVPIDDKTLSNRNDELHFIKFDFVKFFIDRYRFVSVLSPDNIEISFDFDQENYDEILLKIDKIKNKKLKRMNDKILKANLLKM